jgi:hypothetical protein
MNKKLSVTGLFLAAIIIFTACKKDAVAVIDTTNNGTYKIFSAGNITTVQNLMADTILGLDAVSGQPYGSGRYTFFSLETGAQVSSSDSSTNKWDIAFRGTTILTNSGVSGSGNGGGFVQIGTFESLTAISADSTFRTDSIPGKYAITTGSNKGWYNYDGANNLITPLPGRILVFRTASGKYAKLEITNYYRGGVTPPSTATDAIKLSEQRHYNFRFTFQPNGSKSF